MTEPKAQCRNCYWWDAEAYAPNPVYHACHSLQGELDGVVATYDHTCEHHRPVSPDDPATTWNRKQPGRKTRSPRAPKDPAAVKRGKSSKRKGKRLEKLWGEFVCRLAGGRFIQRGHDHSHKDDEFFGNCFEGVLHSEVKGRKAFAFVAYCKQATADAHQHGLPRWAVAAKADREPWYVITDAGDYIRDQIELHDLRTIVDALKLEERVTSEDAER